MCLCVRPMCKCCLVCVSGYVYVDLRSEEEIVKALKKNKDYIGNQYYVSLLQLHIMFGFM